MASIPTFLKTLSIFIAKSLSLLALFCVLFVAFGQIISHATAEHIKSGEMTQHSSRFYVAILPGSEGDPFDVVSLNKIGDQTGSLLLMPKRKDEFNQVNVYNSSRRRICCKYTVIEKIGSDQVIEVQYHSNDYDFISRYRVSGNKITPLSWRILYVGTAVGAFPLALLTTFIFYKLITRIYSRLR